MCLNVALSCVTYSVRGGLGVFLGFFAFTSRISLHPGTSYSHNMSVRASPEVRRRGKYIWGLVLVCFGFFPFFLYCTRFIQKIHMTQFYPDF